MFEIGWSEILVIAVVAIVVIGPKDLPRALRAVGQWTGRLKRMARDFQHQFDEAIREAELDGVQRDMEEIGKLDPVGDIRAAVAQAGQDIQRDLQISEPPPAAADALASVPSIKPPAAPVEVAAPEPAPVAPIETKP